MTDTPGTLEERLRARIKKINGWIANCDRIAELMAPEMERFEKREGHNIYATRLAVDHESEKRSHVKHVKELTEAADEIASLRARVEVLSQYLGIAIEDFDCHFGRSNNEAHWSNEARRALKDTSNAD